AASIIRSVSRSVRSAFSSSVHVKLNRSTASFRCRSSSRDTDVGRLGIAVSLAEAAYSDGPPREEATGVPDHSTRSGERLHAARPAVRRSVRVAGTARRSGDPGVDRRAGGRHARAAERCARTRLAGPSDEVLVFAVPAPDGALVAFGKA